MSGHAFDADEVRRAKYTIYVNSACCAGWIAINALGARILEAPRLLGLAGSALAMIASWAFALADLRRGRVMRGVLNYVVSGLLLLLAMSLAVPEMAILFVFATFIFLAFGLSYAERAASLWIVALTLAVAAAMLATSLGLGWRSGVDPEVLRWVNLIGMAMALSIDATQFIALRETLQARAERIAGAEQRLRVERDRLRAVVDASVDAIVGIDANGVITEFNPAAERTFGLEAAAAIGRPLSAHVHGLALDRGDRIEMTATRADGTELPVEVAIVPTTGATGDRGYVGFLRDLSAHKRAEEGQVLWQHALDQAGFGLIVSERGTRAIRRVNRAYAKIVDREIDELLGTPGDRLVAPSSRAALGALSVTLRERGNYTYEMQLVRRDGAIVPVLASSSPVDTVAGEKLLVSTVIDISERQAAAARLALVSNAAHEFASASGDVEALIDLVARRLGEAIGDGVVIWLAGDDREAREPRASFHHRDPELRDAARAFAVAGIADRVVATGQALLAPTVDPSSDASGLGVATLLALPLRSHGRTTGVVTLWRATGGTPYTIEDQHLAQDLADRAGLALDNAVLVATLERRVTERTAELEAANLELEAFSFTVSHDLRAPLRAIDGFAHALDDEHRMHLDPEGQHYIERILKSTRRMARLIEDLLALARISRTPLQITSVDLSRIATEVAEELRRRTPARSVVVEIAPGLVARADARLVTVVLENLLGNAWKFTAKAGEARIIVGARDGAFLVRDNGAGFDMAFATKLFEPFQRMHAANDFEGEGIGLATVHRIVRHHRGRIWAESVIGEGATLYFTLGDHR